MSRNEISYRALEDKARGVRRGKKSPSGAKELFQPAILKKLNPKHKIPTHRGRAKHGRGARPYLLMSSLFSNFFTMPSIAT